MDFTMAEELVDIAGLTGELFGDLSTIDRVREVEAADHPHDERLWQELGKAGLLGLALPEAVCGAGLGLDAACVVLEAQGRHVAPVAIWPHIVGSLALSTADVGAHRELLEALAEGRERITVALEEFDAAEPRLPGCRAEQDAAGVWRLTGTKAVVPSPTGCGWLLVSAMTDAGPGLFLVDTANVSFEVARTTSLDLAGNLDLKAIPATPVGEPGDDLLASVLRWSTLALAAVQVGVADGAMRLAASYTSEREQFGRPLGSFQAVQHQIADCWIDVEAMRVTLAEALSRNSGASAEPVEAERSALVAKWWCDQSGLDVVNRAQHLHGGIGVDVDYPSHRYFLWGKQISTTLGGSGAALADLGALVARVPVHT